MGFDRLRRGVGFALLIPVLLLTGPTACRSQGRAEAGADTTGQTQAASAAPAPRPDAQGDVADGTTDSMTDDGMTDGGAIRMQGIRQQILVGQDSLWAEALRIHYNAIVVDGHVDTPTLMLDEGYRLAERHPPHRSHVDLPRMVEGGLDAAFFSIYVAPGFGEGDRAVARARALIDEVKRQVAAVPDSAEMAYSAADVRRIARSHRKAVLLGIEGGHALAASPDVLGAMHAAGVRYVTLTHINANAWADASQAVARWNGLNDLGRRMVAEMNRLGVLVDLSHTSDSTFYDALAATRAPVILSHSSARALVDNVRNVDDAMLRALARNGGVVMINFFDRVVNPHLTPDVFEEAYRRLGGRGANLYNLWNTVDAVKRERGLGGSTVADVVDHIDHAVKVAGVDHVGLGSDFDGVYALPAGLQDATRLPWITYELLKRGYTEEDLYKLLGGNVLRVMETAERVAAEMR